MLLMHTKLPEFIKKMKIAAATKGNEPKECDVTGLEAYKSAKMQSLRTGRIEVAVGDIAKHADVERIEVHVMPRVPETMHTAVIRGFDKDGNVTHAILETVNVLHETEDIYTGYCPDVQDRRSPIGNH